MKKVTQRFNKRLLVALLAVAISMSLLPATARAASGNSVQVKVSYFDPSDNYGGFIVPRSEISVEAGLAEKYGYAYGAGVGAGDVTLLDALVAIHLPTYGDKVADALVVSGGFVSKSMGVEGAAMGYSVNGAVTGGTDVTVLKDGDIVEFYIYKDNAGWSDTYSWFEQGGKRADVITSTPGESFDIKLQRSVYDASWNPVAEPAVGAAIATVGADGLLKAYETYVVDADGNVTLIFDANGTYYVSAIGAQDTAPLVAPWLEVNVSDKDSDTGVAPTAVPTATPEIGIDTDTDAARDAAIKYLIAQVPSPIVGSVGGEWSVFALARDGSITATQKKAYLAATDNYTTDKYIDYSRITLALTSLGVDASAYAAKLTEYDQVTSQGVNGTGYALLALDSKPYASENTDIRQQYIDYILGEQIAGGGWNWGFGDEADVDLTAMTIQALAAYYDSNVDVSTAIDNAIAVLQVLQDKTTGGYFAWGVETAESAAQVIVALTALGKDPTGEDWTVNGDHNLITSLLSFKDATGGFKYADAVSQLTTEQAAYALVAYDRFENGLSPLFDLTDVDIDADAGDDTQPEVVNPQTGDLSLALPFAALLASVAGLLYMSRRRRVAKR